MIMKRYFNICILAFAVLSILFSRCNFGAGSYANAQYYRFDLDRSELIDKINKFKDENPEYRLKRTDDKGNSLDGFDKPHNFYTNYFYIKKYNMTIHTIISTGRYSEPRPSKIGLHAITYSDNFSSWKRINTKDLSREENKEIKKIFETEILDKLGKWEKH